jgi:hypothetical protein
MCLHFTSKKETAGVIENYSEFDVRFVVMFLQVEGMSHHRLMSVYGQNVFS